MTPSLSRTLDWTAAERKSLGFSYLHGTDLLANSTDLGADGFVSSLTNPLPELSVAIWDAARGDDAERAYRLQSQFSRLAQRDRLRADAGVPGSDLPPSRPPRRGCSRPRCGRSTPRRPVASSRSSSPSASSPRRPRPGRSPSSPVLQKSGATLA